MKSMIFHSFHHRLFRQRRFRKMLIVSIIFSAVVAIIIVPIERAAGDSTILTLSDGLWWVVQTATTVGYGDVTPVTGFGRLIGIIMQILGTVMFGTLIAMISSSMGRSQEEMYWTRLFDRIDEIGKRVDKVEHETRYLVRSEADTVERTVEK